MTRFAQILDERTDTELVRAVNEYAPEDASVAMSELVKRRVRELQYSLDEFNQKSERYLKSIRILTLALILLIAMLAAPMLKALF